MGRPPTNGLPAFRFTPMEVAQLEAILEEHKYQMPAKEIIEGLADKFSKSVERAGKIMVQVKQVWNWFQNKRSALKAKMVRSPGKLTVTSMPRPDVKPVGVVPQAPQPLPAPSKAGKTAPENSQMEFEAKSARDGAWYDVQGFLSHRHLETGDPDLPGSQEVLVRFIGFGPEEDEWINVCRHVRQRSLPCESTECVAVLPGDLILCFQEGKEQALYFDANVLDAQRRRHDVRGCRCRFLVRYVHDQTEEIVPLRKVCRRPETDYRLHILHAAKDSASTDSHKAAADCTSSTSMRMPNSHEATSAYQEATTIPNSTAAASEVNMDPAPLALANVVATSETTAPTQADTATPVMAVQANATTTTPSTMAPAQAKISVTPGIVPPAQTNINPITGTTAPAGASAAVANVPAAPQTTDTEPNEADQVVVVTAVPALLSMTATTMTTPHQKRGDVSPPSGFIEVPSINPTASSTAPPCDPVEQ